jgi:hypothetical protein
MQVFVVQLFRREILIMDVMEHSEQIRIEIRGYTVYKLFLDVATNRIEIHQIAVKVDFAQSFEIAFIGQRDRGCVLRSSHFVI